MVAQPMEDINTCLANKLCSDFVSCYTQEKNNTNGQSPQPTSEHEGEHLKLTSCAASGQWQPSYPRDRFDAWALVRKGAISPSGELMCATVTFVGVGADLVLAPCNPIIRTITKDPGLAAYQKLHSYRGWDNQSFFVSTRGSYTGTGRILLAYGSVRLDDFTDDLCIGPGSPGKLSIVACLDMTAHDFTTTVSNDWGLYPPEGPSSNVTRPSVLKDDTAGGNICVGLQL